MESYDKMTKKELFEICESLHLTSYKSKTKPELISLIKNKKKEKIVHLEEIEEIEDNLSSDEEEVIIEKIEQLTLSEPVFENMFKRIDKLDNVENVVVKDTKDSKIVRLYELLHNANMRALNMQFKYRAEYPTAVYNNLEALKRRINIYNV
jgi:hypothetical protein